MSLKVLIANNKIKNSYINLIYSESYVYNNKGFIVEKTVINGNTTDIYNYTYDNLGRLTEVIKNDATIESYSFDSNGNRISEAFFTEYDNQDRMTRYKDNLYDYTQRGSLREKTTANGTTLYNYDVIGNLRGVTLEDGTVIDYVIDGRNRRIAKKVNGVVVQKFLYLNQLEPIAELDGNNNLVSLFVYGSKGNVPEYIIKSGVAYKVITNQLGSVVKVINAYGGMVQQEIEYDSFGNILSDSNPTFQPFRLAGGLYDVDTKLIRFGARDYDAETGRWTSKDPIKFDGGRNFYVYGENNPIYYIDIDGMKPKKDKNGFYIPDADLTAAYNNGDYKKLQDLVKNGKQINWSMLKDRDKAVENFYEEVKCISIKENKEYGAGFRFIGGEYTNFTGTRFGEKDKLLGAMRTGYGRAAFAHTHGASDPKYDGRHFSDSDINFANNSEVDLYLLSTSGSIMVYINDIDAIIYLGSININSCTHY